MNNLVYITGMIYQGYLETYPPSEKLRYEHNSGVLHSNFDYYGRISSFPGEEHIGWVINNKCYTKNEVEEYYFKGDFSGCAPVGITIKNTMIKPEKIEIQEHYTLTTKEDVLSLVKDCLDNNKTFSCGELLEPIFSFANPDQKPFYMVSVKYDKE